MSNLRLPAGTYQIDTMHTQLGFAVTHLDISVVSGMFDSFDGSLTVGESPESESGDTNLFRCGTVVFRRSRTSMRRPAC